MTDPGTPDFYRLRREGIGRIETTASASWTDYNLHDPGITVLEAAAYAQTELAYRTDFPLSDILASSEGNASVGTTEVPYPDQAFFTARSILTVNPTTPTDLRRLLIDLDQVRNAWVQCLPCGCQTPYFAWCDDGELVLSHDPRERPETAGELTRVDPEGLYDVLLDLEDDPQLGDLNDRAIVRRRIITDADQRRRTLTIEARFPSWPLARRDERARLAADDGPFTVSLSGPQRTRTGTTPVDGAELRAHWTDVFYVDLALTLADSTVIHIENMSVRLYGDSVVRDRVTVADLLGWLSAVEEDGFVDPYRRKLALVDHAVERATSTMDLHRNLDEDRCRVELVEVVDIAVCADVTVDPAADIEQVQAQIWFAIERYLDPPVEFGSLDDKLAAGEPVEEIFNGPELRNGFVSAQALVDSELRSELRVSDILDQLIDIEGVVSVERTRLTAYAGDGTPVFGVVDPTWVDGEPVFDPTRMSASWLMFLPPRSRPRLHRRLSRFLFAADGLPFLPRTDEAEDTLLQLHGQVARPKLTSTDLDLPTPVGQARDLAAYFPLRLCLPQTYGISRAGLPSTASTLRHAQAQQLRAYLMVFDQLLADAYAQVAHVGDLFSLDPAVEHTYFSRLFDPEEIPGYNEVVDALTADGLGQLTEGAGVFVERRNRFLDHLLARFAESLREYALLLTSLEGTQTARAELIGTKLAFLRALPALGHDRGAGWDRTTPAPCDPASTSGLQRRVTLMLGLPEVTVTYRAAKDASPTGYVHLLTLHVDSAAPATLPFDPPGEVAAALEAIVVDRGLDGSGDWSLESGPDGTALTTSSDGESDVTDLVVDGVAADSQVAALLAQVGAARRSVLTALTPLDHYTVALVDPAKPDGPWRISVADDSLDAAVEEPAATEQQAWAQASRIASAVAHARSLVVEHLLLRPKFPGDALYPSCPGGGCGCGDEDPYSFQLTYVMPGWTAPLSTDMAVRDFADRTVREQTPSHLLVKTCWVGNDGFVPDPCDPLVSRFATLLDASIADEDASCACAAEIYQRYAEAFEEWFGPTTAGRLTTPALVQRLGILWGDEVDLSGVACAGVVDDALRADLDDLATDHFSGLARTGFQFERFTDAWCRWAEADAAMDWSDELLQDTVTEVLAAAVTTPGTTKEALCTCAARVLVGFGSSFRAWMVGNIDAGREPADFDPFLSPALDICPGLSFEPGLINDLRVLIGERYASYVEVSFRLHLLLDALAGLRTTYPRAALHDCDAGSDFNPIRLGQTALGSN